MVVDCVCIILGKPLSPSITIEQMKVTKDMTYAFIKDSWDFSAKAVFFDATFLKQLKGFNRDSLNDETCELLEPYFRIPEFSPETAKSASGAAEGLCKWVAAMKSFRTVYKDVQPKMEKLKEAEDSLAKAAKELLSKESELKAAMDLLATKEEEKRLANEEADRAKRELQGYQSKLRSADNLINSLRENEDRWKVDKANFFEKKKQLIGDIALACAFVS